MHIDIFQLTEMEKTLIIVLTVLNLLVLTVLIASVIIWAFARKKKMNQNCNTNVYFENKLSSLEVT